MNPQFEFDRFTDSAIKVVVAAEREARWFGEDGILPLHILLGLIAELHGFLAIKIVDARTAVGTLRTPHRVEFSQVIPFSPGALELLQISRQEAMKFQQKKIRPEHILVALIEQGDPKSLELLTRLGIDITKLGETAIVRAQQSGNPSVILLEPPRSFNSDKKQPSTEGKSVYMLAQEEAWRLGHKFVGTEEILLGLIAEKNGIAARALQSVGVTLENARAAVETFVGHGATFVPADIPYSTEAKRILDLAWAGSTDLGEETVDSAHLLLAILLEGRSGAVRVLVSLGVDLHVLSERAIHFAKLKYMFDGRTIFGMLLSLLGKLQYDPRFTNVLEQLGHCEEHRTRRNTFLDFAKSGVQMLLENDRLAAIILFIASPAVKDGRIEGYFGNLPSGIQAHDEPDTVQKKLGLNPLSWHHESGHNWQRYQYPQFELTFVFDNFDQKMIVVSLRHRETSDFSWEYDYVTPRFDPE